MSTQTVDKGLHRSREASVGGVCAGLAERFDLDPIVIRILAIFIVLLTGGLGLIAYAVLWVRFPRDAESDAPYEILPESAESSSFGCVDCSTGRVAGHHESKAASGISITIRLFIAAGLMMLFLVVAVNLSPLVPGTEWWQFWPLAIIIAGLCLVIIPVPSHYEAVWHVFGIVVASAGAAFTPLSLNLVSWSIVPFALSKVWLLPAMGVVLLALGIYRKSGVLMVAAACCIVVLCIVLLMLCMFPVDMQSFLMRIPDIQLF